MVKRSVRYFILSLAAVFGLSVPPCFAADVSAAFESANQLYEQGKFSEAASAYEKALESGVSSPALYFNLGNARFRSGEVGRAIAAYRKAEQLAPRDPDIRANLQFIRNQIQGPKIVPSRWQQWLAKLAVNEWAILVAGALWLWMLLLILMQFRPALKKSLRSLVWAGGFLIVVLGICLASVLFSRSARTVIVAVPDASVRNGPFDESPNAFAVHDGAELKVLDQKSGWFQVSAGNRIGWLKQEQVVVPR
jgi:tetratricopeptide (TPR) repeat protein